MTQNQNSVLKSSYYSDQSQQTQTTKWTNYNSKQARKNGCEQVTIGFSFTSDWLRKWRELFLQSRVLTKRPLVLLEKRRTLPGSCFALQCFFLFFFCCWQNKVRMARGRRIYAWISCFMRSGLLSTTPSLFSLCTGFHGCLWKAGVYSSWRKSFKRQKRDQQNNLGLVDEVGGILTHALFKGRCCRM